MSKKIIKKGTVQETLLIPLYGRKLAMDMYPGNFHDMDCQKIFEQVEMVHEKKGIMEKPGAIMAATRQYDMAAACKEYLKTHPNRMIQLIHCLYRSSVLRSVLRIWYPHVYSYLFTIHIVSPFFQLIPPLEYKHALFSSSLQSHTYH